MPEPEERRDGDARQNRTHAPLPARGEKGHPPRLLPEGDEHRDEKDLKNIGRNELRKVCGERGERARSLDEHSREQQQDGCAEQSQEIPLRSGAPVEHATAELACSGSAIGDPGDEESAARERDERQQEDRRLRRQVEREQAETRRSQQWR